MTADVSREQTLTVIRECVRRGDYMFRLLTPRSCVNGGSVLMMLKRRFAMGKSSKTIPMTQEGRAALSSAGPAVGLFMSCVVGLKNSGS